MARTVSRTVRSKGQFALAIARNHAQMECIFERYSNQGRTVRHRSRLNDVVAHRRNYANDLQNPWNLRLGIVRELQLAPQSLFAGLNLIAKSSSMTATLEWPGVHFSRLNSRPFRAATAPEIIRSHHV